MAQKRSLILILVLSLITVSCRTNPRIDTTTPESDIPNPASEYCVSQGYQLEIITAEDGSQSGLCVFDDGSSCDEWAFFRGECGPESEAETTAEPDAGLPTPENTPEGESPLPTINPEEYQDWWTYTHPVYGFSLLLPDDWTVEEETSSTNMLSGHLIILHPDPALNESIRITFRQSGEDILLWPTGVGQGEFVPQGTMEIDGVTVQRNQLVCPTGEVTSIYYQGTQGDPFVSLDGLEFGFIFSASSNHCQTGFTIAGKTQVLGEKILSSLRVP